MNGVSEGIENGGDVEIDALFVPPDIRHRDGNILSECPGPVDPHSPGVCAKVPASGQAVPAAPAHDVTLGANDISFMKIGHVGPGVDNLADELVADHHGDRNGALRPFVPVINVQIGTADTRSEHADQYIIDSDNGLRDIFEPEPRLSATLYKCFHDLTSLSGHLAPIGAVKELTR